MTISTKIPEDLFEQLDLVVWVFLCIFLLKKCSSVGHGSCVYLRKWFKQLIPQDFSFLVGQKVLIALW